MAAQNLFEELKTVLNDFKSFLHDNDNVNTIKTAVQALAALVPQINELITKLIDLMGKLKAEIQKLDISAVPELAAASQFTTKVKAFLTAAKNLLPDEAATIDDVLGVADVVSGLSGLSDQVKGEILSLIDEIITDLNSLKSA